MASLSPIDISHIAAKAHLVGFHGLVLHLKVPHFDSEVVPRHQEAAAMAELDVRDGRDDLGEEGASGGILRLLEVCKGQQKKKWLAPDRADTSELCGGSRLKRHVAGSLIIHGEKIQSASCRGWWGMSGGTIPGRCSSCNSSCCYLCVCGCVCVFRKTAVGQHTV